MWRIFIASTQGHLWTLQSFFKEVVLWKNLRHPNIVPFIGVTTNPLQLVLEWMPNGTLTEFVEKNPSASRIDLVSPSPQSSLIDNITFPSYWV